ncbi:hypothetical protein A3860_34310 [Niastella vici]|uniref:Cytochrome c domain-containing protein n=1 Tax=Niastella vici TaxID=1703345 RepID=A0A1V9FPH6_9BACT|nr:cytochrome c [Niastella vici]OQP60156.1 hypothetical protein A3860_34310 [Niastella vici]
MKRKIIITASLLVATLIVIIQSCVSTKVTDKSGNQLWSENCQRCHNTPPSSAFTNIQWEIVNTHMKQRAMLTDEEYKKILDFMQQGD